MLRRGRNKHKTLANVCVIRAIQQETNNEMRIWILSSIKMEIEKHKFYDSDKQ